MRTSLKLVAVVVVILAMATGSRSLAQEATPAAKQQLRAVKWNGDIMFIVFHMSQAYETTIGLEVDPHQLKTDIGFYLEQATLPGVMDAIVQSGPNYQWRERDGSIEVFPTTASSSLLDTMISNFRVDGVDQQEAFNRLLDLPELQAAMKAMNLSRRETPNAAKEKRTEKLSLSLESVTMRQALNKIVQADGGHFWMFRRESRDSFSIVGTPAQL